MKDELEGKEVKFISAFGKVYSAEITGFDYWIGITIQEKHTGKYLFCGRGPQTSLVKEKTYDSPNEKTRNIAYNKYIRTIAYIRKQVRENRPIHIFDIFRINDVLDSSSPDADFCPFGK